MGRFTLAFLLAATLVARVAFAADDPFVGEWKVDSSKSRVIDQMKVANVGPNKYNFDFGGSDETIVADGTDQPGYGGTTFAVSAVGPDSWKVVRKQDGRVIIRADWKLSKDGNSLADHFTSIASDGTASTEDLLYARTVGTSGFAGTWERTVEKVDPFVLKIQPYEEDGLSITNPAAGVTRDVRFDGKDYAPTGPNAFKGTTFSARRISKSELDEADKYDGKVVATKQFTLSSDLKTLTLTIHTPSKRSPDVYVFERQ